MRPMKVIVLWSILVLCGFLILIRYSTTAGSSDIGNPSWPANSAIHCDGDRPNLLVFLHPNCPCSRATVEELAKLNARIGDKVDTKVIFVQLEGFQEHAEQSSLWSQARMIPHVQTIADSDGIEARRFGAATSGCTLLFDPQGRVVFRGGITSARGHEGDNPGSDAILDWFRSGGAGIREVPVFGCPLFDDHVIHEKSK